MLLVQYPPGVTKVLTVDFHIFFGGGADIEVYICTSIFSFAFALLLLGNLANWKLF